MPARVVPTDLASAARSSTLEELDLGAGGGYDSTSRPATPYRVVLRRQVVKVEDMSGPPQRCGTASPRRRRCPARSGGTAENTMSGRLRGFERRVHRHGAQMRFARSERPHRWSNRGSEQECQRRTSAWVSSPGSPSDRSELYRLSAGPAPSTGSASPVQTHHAEEEQPRGGASFLTTMMGSEAMPARTAPATAMPLRDGRARGAQSGFPPLRPRPSRATCSDRAPTPLHGKGRSCHGTHRTDKQRQVRRWGITRT
jgi:hypothetical protein